MCCAKKFSNLLNCPIMGLLVSRVCRPRANISIKSQLFATKAEGVRGSQARKSNCGTSVSRMVRNNFLLKLGLFGLNFPMYASAPGPIVLIVLQRLFFSSLNTHFFLQLLAFTNFNLLLFGFNPCFINRV
jgi:hypothetical protein